MARRMAGMIQPRLRDSQSSRLARSASVTVVRLGVVTLGTGTGHSCHGIYWFSYAGLGHA